MDELRNRWIGSNRGSSENKAASRPRWRLLECVDAQQRNVSRNAHRRLAHGSGNNNFFANAFSAFLSKMCIATFSSPVGIELSASHLTAGQPAQAYMNSQDRANASRGISPTTIYRLKMAALNAMQQTRQVNPRSLKLTLLPHTSGEVLISHHNGWTGRGIAWREGSAQIALVWQVNASTASLPVRIGV